MFTKSYPFNQKFETKTQIFLVPELCQQHGSGKASVTLNKSTAPTMWSCHHMVSYNVTYVRVANCGFSVWVSNSQWENNKNVF